MVDNNYILTSYHLSSDSKLKYNSQNGKTYIRAGIIGFKDI